MKITVWRAGTKLTAEYEGVTFVKAVERYSRTYVPEGEFLKEGSVLVHARYKDHATIFDFIVRREIKYNIIPLRKDRDAESTK